MNVIAVENEDGSATVVSVTSAAPQIEAASRIFRVVPIEAAARGSWNDGPLVHAASEEEVRRTHPDGVLVELLTDRQKLVRSLDGRMQRRARADEDEQGRRMFASRQRFIDALSSELPSTRSIP